MRLLSCRSSTPRAARNRGAKTLVIASPASDDEPIAAPPRGSGRLAENILYFARALREAGLPVGPGSVLDALAAVEAAGIGDRADFYATLHAVFVKKHEHSILFDQAFRIFWKRKGFLEKLIAMMSPQADPTKQKKQKAEAGASRVADALFKNAAGRGEGGAFARSRRALHHVGGRNPADQGFRADERGRNRARASLIARLPLPRRCGEDAAPFRQRAWPAHRSAPHRSAARCATAARSSISPFARPPCAIRRSSRSATYRAR